MEFSILYAIPHTAVLDSCILGLDKMVGSIGQLFLITGILLTIFKKTRRTGIAVLISYFGVLLFGQLILKHLISRARPCQIDLNFPLLLERPTSSSFPSTHAAWAFGTATAIFMKYRKVGIACFVFAALIAFSRLYLFMHFPTDVLFGVIMGVVLGIASVKLCDKYYKRKDETSPEKENR